MVYVLAGAGVADLTTLCDSGWEGCGAERRKHALAGEAAAPDGPVLEFRA